MSLCTILDYSLKVFLGTEKAQTFGTTFKAKKGRQKLFLYFVFNKGPLRDSTTQLP